MTRQPKVLPSPPANLPVAGAPRRRACLPVRGLQAFALILPALLLAACASALQSTQDRARGEIAIAAGRTLADSAPLCVLLGPAGSHPGVYGTDLGFTVSARGDDDRQWILFGDTWGEAGDACRYTPEDADDLFAWLPRTLPHALPHSPDALRPCKVIEYQLGSRQDLRTWSRCRMYDRPQGDSHTRMPLSMGFLRTPLGAFASADAVYGIFHRSQPQHCREDSQCSGSMRCSSSLPDVHVGICKLPEVAPGGGAGNFCRSDDDCMLGTCEVPKDGMCISRMPFKVHTADGNFAPSWYRDNPLRGLAKVVQIARMKGPRPGDFLVEAEFTTNRFLNLTARSVAHFDPEHPEDNDYRPGHHTLLVWGRPAFAGERGAQSLPFLLYQRLPEAGQALHWHPHFFAGMDAAGQPTWTEDEEEAHPIYGGQPTVAFDNGKPHFSWPDAEFDHVNQMAVSWLPDAQRWVMLYGGDMPDFMLLDENGERLPAVHKQPAQGAIHLRHARHPWGGPDPQQAWSTPLPIFTRKQAAPYMACPDSGESEMPGCLAKGDPHGPFSLLGTLVDHAVSLRPGAFFEVAGQCMVGDATWDILQAMSGNQVGRLYGVNIIDTWTQTQRNPEGHAESVDLYWNASTWNPYQVILIRTRIDLPKLRQP